MQDLFIPKDYRAHLDVKTTEKAIKQIKDFFQLNLSSELKLSRVTAPMIVFKGTGINDDLNGIEKPVGFKAKHLQNQDVEIVQSLAKWKRLKLHEMKAEKDSGIYTDMNALRPDEIPGNLHSIYVDQWDWEKVISEQQRTVKHLRFTVKKIYEVLKRTEFYMYDQYPGLKPGLPEDITFIHAEELLRKFPDLTPNERENKAAEKYGAIFIIGIGHVLNNGEPHDGRAPDYDDWSTPTFNGYHGLNGDIILWNPVLKRAFEISSMGIRVDQKSLLQQLKIRNTEERKDLFFHKKLLSGELPYSMGGGIGQSRLCMFFLRKAHIGEVQSSIWPEEMKSKCESAGICLL